MHFLKQLSPWHHKGNYFNRKWRQNPVKTLLCWNDEGSKVKGQTTESATYKVHYYIAGVLYWPLPKQLILKIEV